MGNINKNNTLGQSEIFLPNFSMRRLSSSSSYDELEIPDVKVETVSDDEEMDFRRSLLLDEENDEVQLLVLKKSNSFSHMERDFDDIIF